MEKNIYSRSRISVRILDVVIIIGLLALASSIVFLSVNGGFDIRFDSGGGSHVDAQRLRYGEAISVPDAPTRENYTFVGWYADRGLTEKVDLSEMTATQSVTFYAAWVENEE